MCLSFVAGFIGHRLLPIVAERLQQQVADAKQTAQQANERVESRVRVDEAVDAAYEYLQQAREQDVELSAESVQAHIRCLEDLSDQEPTRRRLHIVLGRLYKAQKNYDKAIEVLTRFIKAKMACSEGEDEHTAAAHYNRACYRSLMSEALHAKGDENYAQEMKKAAIEDLKKSFISRSAGPAYVAFARKPDKDLNLLQGEESYRQLLEEASNPR